MTRAARRPRAPPELGGQLEQPLERRVDIRPARPTSKANENEPSSGLTLIVGWIRRPRNGARARSRARSRGEAMFS